MRNRAFIYAVGALLVVLIGSGCGDDGDEAVSKAAFVRQADATCAEERQKLRANPGSGMKDRIDRAIAALRAEVDEMESIGAPAGDEAKVDAIVTNVKRTIALLEENPKSVFEEAGEKMLQAEKLAAEYGLKSCLLRFN